MLAPHSQSLRSLLPEAVATVEAQPCHWQSQLHAVEQDYVDGRRMHARRLAEFRAGRACARDALAQIGRHDWPLIPAASREPQWPEGVVGSITHSGDYCAAAVAATYAMAAIGIDAEATDRCAESAAPFICTDRELAQLDSCRAIGRRILLTLIFSAKESVFKAIFPRGRVLLDMRDVEIEILADRGTFRGRCLSTDCADAVAGIEGRFDVSAARVLTVATLRARPAHTKYLFHPLGMSCAY